MKWQKLRIGIFGRYATSVELVRRVGSKSDLFGREDAAEGSTREGWGL